MNIYSFRAQQGRRSGRCIHNCAENKDTKKYSKNNSITLWLLFFFFFFAFKKILNFQFFCLSDRSLFVAKTCLSERTFPDFFFTFGGLTKFEKTCHSDRIFAENFFACASAAGWLIYQLHLGILFSLKKLSQRHYWVVSFRQLFSSKRIPKCNS